MRGTTNELPKMAASNEEDIISEMLSLHYKKLKTSQMRMMRLQYVPIAARRVVI